MICEYCGKDENKCKATINNISLGGDTGIYAESLNSNEIGPGKKYIDVTDKVLNRWNPWFIRKN